MKRLMRWYAEVEDDRRDHAESVGVRIMTGILLAIARIAGETAPLLFTALSNQFWSTDMMQPIANLPVTIFKFAMSPFAEWRQLARAGVLIITLCVLLLNILARVVLRRINTVNTLLDAA